MPAEIARRPTTALTGTGLCLRASPTRVTSLPCTLAVYVYTDVYSIVRFEWDDAKSDANLHQRGFDFPFASLIFDGPTFEVEDRRRDYGERRIVAIGVADNIHLTVVYTDRLGGQGEVLRRIISSHRSSRRERTIYEKAVKRA